MNRSVELQFCKDGRVLETCYTAMYGQHRCTAHLKTVDVVNVMCFYNKTMSAKRAQTCTDRKADKYPSTNSLVVLWAEMCSPKTHTLKP